MSEIDREAALCILNALPRVGVVTLRRLLQSFDNDPLAILSASETVLRDVHGVSECVADVVLHWHKHFSYKREKARLQLMRAEFMSYENEAYPALLKTIYDPPIGLYFCGPVRPTNAIAVIGSRRPTLYGLQIAERLATGLAERGFCVVSGFARGIDTAVHRSVLKCGGQTVAILGCGIDHVYPPENADLYGQLRERGALVSEFRLGLRADRSHFPRRNRILSGISQAVVVVESDREGGSMITTEYASEHNRHVFAVPGRIDSEMSRGCHQLIRNGATLVTSVEDILEDLPVSEQIQFGLELGSQIRQIRRTELPPPPGETEKKIFEQIKFNGPLYADQILEIIDIPSSDLQIALLQLELQGYIVKRVSGLFEAK
jgi:DNA processing protein